MPKKKKADVKNPPEEPREEVKVTPEKKTKVKRRFVGTKYPYWHPFQSKSIPVGGDGVILEMDNWLECQVKAGLVREIID